MRTKSEAIEDLDSRIKGAKERGKNSMLLLEYKIDDSEIEGELTEYYRNKGISAKIRRCPLKKSYEIALWWD